MPEDRVRPADPRRILPFLPVFMVPTPGTAPRTKRRGRAT